MIQKNKDLFKILACLLVCVLLELLFSSYANISLFLSGAKEKEVDLSHAIIYDETSETPVKDTSTPLNLNESTIEFTDINNEMVNISVELDGTVDNVPLTITFTDDSWGGDGAFYANNFNRRITVCGDTTLKFNILAVGKVKSLHLTLPYYSNLEIKSITLNTYSDLGFNFSRFAILFAVALIVVMKGYNILYSEKKHGKCIYGIIVLFIAALIFNTFINAEGMLADYPVKNIWHEDQYVQLFDALQNGRVNLEIFDDLDGLNALENPFDVDARDALYEGGTKSTPLFDHAYYNGKIYCYFGIAPILTVYYPVYLLTGKIPTVAGAVCFMGIPIFIFLSLLYKLCVEKFCKAPPLVLVLLGQIALLGSSLVFSLCFRTGYYVPRAFYFIAVVSGLGWLSFFLYTLLKAYFSDNIKRRIIYLILCGISVPMIVASRPTMCIYCLAAIVPAVFIFFSKEEKLGHKIMYAASVGVPVVIGAVLIMVYNYVRFDSPFEFGFNYQLTNLNSIGNTISLLYLPLTIYHYYLQPPDLLNYYPYFEISSSYFWSYPRYTYVGETMGALYQPITWGMFVISSVISKKDKFKSWFFSVLLGLAILLSFIDMCKGGATLRYSADVLLPLCLVGVIALFNLISMVKKNRKLYIMSYIGIAVILSISMYMGLNLGYTAIP